MIFFKKLHKKIDTLQSQVNELTEIIKTQELEKLRDSNKELSEKAEQLEHIKFHVKTVRAFEDANSGNVVIKVIYELPTINLYFNEDGELIKNEFFKAINELELVPITDMMKVQKIIDQTQQKLK